MFRQKSCLLRKSKLLKANHELVFGIGIPLWVQKKEEPSFVVVAPNYKKILFNHQSKLKLKLPK